MMARIKKHVNAKKMKYHTSSSSITLYMQEMEEWTLYLIIASISFVIFIILAAYMLLGSLRDSVIFRPTRGSLSHANGVYRDEVVDNVMTRWFENGNDTVLFYLHGNSGNINNRDYVEEFARLARADLVLMDYRGYGASKGIPTIENMREDSALVMDKILEKYNPENIIIMSESLGSVAASYLASRYKVRGVVILAGISSFATLSKNANVSSAMQKVASLAMLRMDKETNASLLSKSKSPILILHSEEDEVISFSSALENKEAAPMAKEVVVIEGGHSTPSISRSALRQLLNFIGVEDDDIYKYDSWRQSMRTIGSSLNFRIVDS